MDPFSYLEIQVSIPAPLVEDRAHFQLTNTYMGEIKYISLMSPISLAERSKKFQEIITRQGNRKMYFMRLKHPSTLLFSAFLKWSTFLARYKLPMDLMCVSYFLTIMWITWCNRQPRLQTPNKGQIGEIVSSISSIQSTGQWQFDHHLNMDVQWALTNHPPPMMQRLERQLSQPEKTILNKNLRPTKEAWLGNVSWLSKVCAIHKDPV